MDHYVTPEKLEGLREELQNLKTAKRAEVAERLKNAKELGDLSENSEYFEAREAQEQVELRISELEDIIRNASIIEKGKGGSTVSVGSTIIVKKDGKDSRFTIVGADEAKPEAGLISNESPMGRSFVGRKPGEKVTVKTPKGELEYTIVKIE